MVLEGSFSHSVSHRSPRHAVFLASDMAAGGWGVAGAGAHHRVYSED